MKKYLIPILFLISTLAYAQNYLLDHEANSFHARTGLIRIGDILFALWFGILTRLLQIKHHKVRSGILF